MNKIYLVLLSLLITSSAFAANFGVYSYQDNVINAANNARHHNNMGNIYFQDQNYVSALREYEIAYSLSPNDNLSATYLYNIARCYMVCARYKDAKNILLEVIKTDCMNITYYETLVDCFIKLKIQNKELEKYNKDKSNPYNEIISGLIYLKTNDKRSAKILFDNFITQYPDMIITQDIKRILNNL